MLITINSHTTGKFHREVINNRSHIVTSMMPIRGDIAMKGLFYSNDEVKKSFMQMVRLPVPNGHPKVNGVHISAFDPIAMNAHNIGGFTRNPRMKGKEVFVDVLFDEVVANTTEEGRETIKRIEEGGKIGVSTGLSIDQVINETGVDDFGVKFTRKGFGFKFNHIASLLNETAAGEHAGTEMILNTDDKDDPIFVVNLAHGLGDGVTQTNDLSADDISNKLNTMIQSADEEIFRHVVDIFPESNMFIWSETRGSNHRLFKQSYLVNSNDEVSIIDLAIEVKLIKEFKPTITNEVLEMDQEKLVLTIIGLTTNAFTGDDKDRLMALSESDLIKELTVKTVNKITVEQAREVLTSDGFDFPAFDSFQTNKSAFEDYQKVEKERIDEIKKTIIAANSDYTAEILDGKPEAELLIINKTIEGSKTAVRVGQGKTPSTAFNQAANQSDEYNMES